MLIAARAAAGRHVRHAIGAAIPAGARRAAMRVLTPWAYRWDQQRRRTSATRWSYKPFDDHECIFVHIPKTAGIAVATALFGHRGGGHAGVWRYQLIFSPEEFARYFKFTFVRNPWDRFASAYAYLRRGGTTERDRRWAARTVARYPDFDTFVKGWVNRRNVYTALHFVPQHEFLCVGGSPPLVDFIGRFETLAADVAAAQARLGSAGQLERLNAGPGQDYRALYTDETRQIVADVYREDIELFGYDFESTRYRAGTAG